MGTGLWHFLPISWNCSLKRRRQRRNRLGVLRSRKQSCRARDPLWSSAERSERLGSPAASRRRNELPRSCAANRRWRWSTRQRWSGFHAL